MALSPVGSLGLVRGPARGSRQISFGDIHGLRRVLEQIAPSVVVNSAGKQRGDDEALHEANVTLVGAIAEATTAIGARLVHLGSAAEYGDPGPLPVCETTPCSPISAYGRTKLAGTQLVMGARERGTDAVVLRPFNVIGPGLAAEGPVGELVASVRRLPPGGGTVAIGNATMVRDFISLDFVARCALAAASADRLVAPVINVCSGRGLSLEELARALGAEARRPVTVRSEGWPIIPTVVGDPTLLRRELAIVAQDTISSLARSALALEQVGVTSV